MPDGGGATGLIGPNAILQLQKPLAELVGVGALDRLLVQSRVAKPTGQDMIPEEDVRDVHLALARSFPKHAAAVRSMSGTATGAYIRRHRIPKSAALLLRWLPALLGERILTRAIVCHAWTFCGSGSVSSRRVGEAIEISIRNNPLVETRSDGLLQCDWHEAVFRDLYASLLRRDYRVEETECCGAGAPDCTFRIDRG